MCTTITEHTVGKTTRLNRAVSQ